MTCKKLKYRIYPRKEEMLLNQTSSLYKAMKYQKKGELLFTLPRLILVLKDPNQS